MNRVGYTPDWSRCLQGARAAEALKPGQKRKLEQSSEPWDSKRPRMQDCSEVGSIVQRCRAPCKHDSPFQVDSGLTVMVHACLLPISRFLLVIRASYSDRWLYES